MKLIAMTQNDYDTWKPKSREGYIQDKIRANGYTREEAEKIADESFQRLLPKGLQSEDNFFFIARDENDGMLGYIWFLVRGAPGNRKAFIADVAIEENLRGQGYGRKIMTLVEDRVSELGLKHIGLHVFGFNDAAIGLYKSLGYLTTDLVMEKELL